MVGGDPAVAEVCLMPRSPPIVTGARGRPFERPEPPVKGAPIEDTIAWLQRYHAWQDAIADCANKAFADEFREVI